MFVQIKAVSLYIYVDNYSGTNYIGCTVLCHLFDFWCSKSSFQIQNGMEPNMEDGFQSSPTGSSQGSDSGLAMMSPMESDFSSSVFSQLTSDLQQMLGVGASKGESVCEREGEEKEG